MLAGRNVSSCIELLLVDRDDVIDHLGHHFLILAEARALSLIFIRGVDGCANFPRLQNGVFHLALPRVHTWTSIALRTSDSGSAKK